LVDIDSTLLTI